MNASTYCAGRRLGDRGAANFVLPWPIGDGVLADFYVVLNCRQHLGNIVCRSVRAIKARKAEAEVFVTRHLEFLLSRNDNLVRGMY